MAAQTHDSYPSSSIPANFDVFLSFRGTDTRKNFTDHLYTALLKDGVRTFRDDEELEKGESIEKSLPKAIQESKISIPVFSKNYASSKWCLDELVKIMECKEKIGQKVLPIFLDDASPSDVRKQLGSFAKAFDKHEMRFGKERVDKWRESLRAAGELSGYNLNEVANGHESKLIQIVVKKVLSELNDAYLNVSEHLVGIDSRVKEMIGLLDIEPNDVRVVGICGMGGIGKTTIAKAVHNQIFSNYDGSCFLENVREVSHRPNGLVDLQKQLHFDILKQEIPFIGDVNRGINLIKKKICAKKILVILDDVDQKEQLKALVGRCDRFGPGSRIIITTRDEHLLNVVVVDEIYKPKELDPYQSFQLFSMHAFGRDQPPEDYIELSKSVSLTAGGLPLALEVLGSFLFDKRTRTEWEDTLEKLKNVPHYQVKKKLEISYEGLDREEKDIFLDITCFFIGKDKDVTVNILKGCGFRSRIGITVLIHKSLIKVGDDNKLRMHDQLRDMGREIVRRESPKEPGMCSRLWDYEDVLDVLKRCSGSMNVEGLLLNFEENKQIGLKEGHLSVEAFAPMSRLRLLQINNARIVGNFEHLPKELRYLCWQRCPLKSIPTNFHLEKLVVLDLQYSNITQVWNSWHQNKLVEKLEILNLSHCYSLTKTPNFSGLPSLERLILEGCTRLVEVHESIGHLKRLVFLNLKGCDNLVDLPSSFCMLSSLESLILSDCSKISSLPGNLGNMVALTELLLDNTAIEQLPDSIGHLKSLRRLFLGRAKPVSIMPSTSSRLESPLNLELGRIPVLDLLKSVGSLLKSPSSSMWSLRSLRKNLNFNINKLPVSFSGLCSLQTLNLSNCNLSEGAIPSDFGRLSSLKCLDISYNNFCSLPSSITSLSRLERLDLNRCRKLQSLPEDLGRLSSLKSLNITFTNLCNLPASFSDLSQLVELLSSHCSKLQSLPEDLGRLSSLELLYLVDCNNFCSLPASISGLSRLEDLSLADCPKLQSIPELPSGLSSLDARNCVSIKSLPDLSNMEKLEDIEISGCENLVDTQGLERLESLKFLYMARCNSPQDTMRKGLFQGICERLWSFNLPGSEVPEWFTYQNSLSCEVPKLYGREIQGLIVCLVCLPGELAQIAEGYSSQRTIFCNHFVDVHITRNNIRLPTFRKLTCISKGFPDVGTYLYQFTEDAYHMNLEEGDQIVVLPSPSLKGFQVTKTGIHLVYKPQKGFEPITNAIEDISSQQSSISESLLGFLDSSSSLYVVHGGGSLCGARRGRHDGESGPSSDWSNEERTTKRLRVVSGPTVDLEEKEREGWSCG